MMSLVLQFYIPAFLATLVLALAFSVLYTIIFFTGKKSNEAGQRARFFHELFILNLLNIPVISFALLSILVVLRSIGV